MAEKRIVFVIGAGASKEVNLPTGDELKRSISNLLDIRYSPANSKISGDDFIDSALRADSASNEHPGGAINTYLEAARRIRDAMPLAMSIDEFIDKHSGNKSIELCGKLAIVRAILAAEKTSYLYIDKAHGKSQFDLRRLEDKWYKNFFQILTLNCRKEDLRDRFSNFSLIIFNYDRCIEHFLYHALQRYYEIPEPDAVALCHEINFYHPYGAVGSLPWQSRQHAVDFGEEINSRRLLDIAGQIKTFTEGTDPNSSEIQSIRSTVFSANLAVFLGFSFQKQNLELITPGNQSRAGFSNCRVFGTAYKISDNSCEAIRSDINNLMPWSAGNIVLRNDLTCAELLSQYGRSISAI